ncbi:MAG: AI-2E family transporter [Candidatus Paceibacterota bacterium]
MKEEIKKIDISWQSFGRFYLLFLLTIGIWYFRSFILLALTAFIVASLLDVPIGYLEKKFKNRWFAVFLIYLFSVFLIAVVFYLIFPILGKVFLEFLTPFSSEGNGNFLNKIFEQFKSDSNFFNKWTSFFNIADISGGDIASVFSQAIKFTNKILGGFFSAFLVFLIAFFLNLEKKGVEKSVHLLCPKKYEDYFVFLWEKARKKTVYWFTGQSLLSLIIGCLVFISLIILGVPYAGFLAVLAGIADFIPYFGPLVAGVIISLFGFSQNFSLGVVIAIILIAIQGLENLISPFLRSKTMNLNPLIIILALVVGEKLGGSLGVIVALPLAAALMELLRDIKSGNFSNFVNRNKED